MKRALICILVWSHVSHAFANPAPAGLGHVAPAVGPSGEPSLADVRKAALRYAGLDEQPARGWSRRARLAGLMPVLTVRASRGVARGEDLSRESSGTEQLDIDIDRDLDVEAQAVWQLGRLVFDDVELRIAQLEQQRHRERLQLLAQVTTLYYQRRKLQLAQVAKNPAEAQARTLAIEELTAQLDALTGGYFDRALRATRR